MALWFLLIWDNEIVMGLKLLLKLGLTLTAVFTSNAFANGFAPKYSVGGYPDISATTPYSLAPSSTPRSLETSNQVSDSVRYAIDEYFEKYPATTGFLLLEKGKILFEKYNGVGRETSEFYSMSIAKSLTSLAAGKALCRGLIPSLSTKAETILPALSINNIGKSSIAQLLMMSSGAYKPHKIGQPGYKNGIGYNSLRSKPFTGNPWPLRLGQASISDILWGKMWQDVLDKSAHAPGARFLYKSNDALSVGKLIETATKQPLARFFEREIWQPAATKYRARWESDKDGATVGSSGFQARLRDWGRLALWISDEYKKDSCYGAYLRQSTSRKIELTKPYNIGFNSYGFFWWTENKFAPGFWGVGYGGQFLAINPDSHKILIKFSHRRDPGSTYDIYRLFNTWHRN
jgi:CubicO group peptidase (beta-lactamase class C family)